jgi:hypothetical protein
MPSTVRSLEPEHHIIEVVHHGEIAPADLRASGTKVLELAREGDDWHVLTDCSGITKLPGNLDLLNLIDTLSQAGVNTEFKQALIWPVDDQARLALDFWRTVETNHGLRAKAFGQRDAAIAWLES